MWNPFACCGIKERAPGCDAPLYGLILQRKGELQNETVQVVDAAQAWRLGRKRYPHCIRGVVRRVKAELLNCELLIVLVRETVAVVQVEMQSYADAVIFKSSLGTGKADFVQAL